MIDTSKPVKKARLKQMAREVRKMACHLGAGDCDRTEQLAELILEDPVFSAAVQKRVDAASSIDSEIVQCIANLLSSLRPQGHKGPIPLDKEKVRALICRATISGNETPKELNMKARALKQRERTYAKHQAAVLAYLQDGNFNNFVQYTTQIRANSIRDDPIIQELWHDHCVMKKVNPCTIH